MLGVSWYILRWWTSTRHALFAVIGCGLFCAGWRLGSHLFRCRFVATLLFVPLLFPLWVLLLVTLRYPVQQRRNLALKALYQAVLLTQIGFQVFDLP